MATRAKTGLLGQPAIQYRNLNARQKENYNFLKLSGVLADFGFVTMRVSADWEGADFIAQHNGGNLFLKVQLKSRLTLSKKYEGKDIYIAFRNGSGADSDWYLFPHDDVLERVKSSIGSTRSWGSGNYSWGRLSQNMRRLLDPYRIPSPDDCHR